MGVGRGDVKAKVQQIMPNFQDSENVQCEIAWLRGQSVDLQAMWVSGRAGGYRIYQGADWYPFCL
eukprot:1145227-Pelagomonas_calceolata.AAC.1